VAELEISQLLNKKKRQING